MKVKHKDSLTRTLLISISLLTIGILLWIIAYIFVNGISHIDLVKLFPPMVSTLFIVVIGLAISAPIGIGAAIYLNEYAKDGKFVRGIRFATESLAAVPSILFGLFGMMFFQINLKLGFSMLSGALTVSMMVLPTIVKTTEEALKTVPTSYREGSLALGATKYATIAKVVLPSALPGILTGIVLGMGRIVGETAAIYLTAGTMYRLPLSAMESGRTLAVHLYLLAKEGISFDEAYGTALVLLVVILCLNLTTYFIGNKLNKSSSK
ncbi:phosphate ABC transporter, permease protein PstA [Sporanaerobium hydrogeniformans]|uniref:Phosphate ABC transporter, permease protein PstA n=1 Tax=Sporanaerobium hydrogeniformans TaxID=3072179 RepID=A0AC61DAM2_9FIRM|nr:phosphate ABC transporter permease PstA [Sporanaerobium hydrogeniformans]PHV70336.1 phosphate ABC transporter, permease protein PstA [Sporanaerobium hydrogeniformans]